MACLPYTYDFELYNNPNWTTEIPSKQHPEIELLYRDCFKKKCPSFLSLFGGYIKASFYKYVEFLNCLHN